jgi:hypothetical protein
MLVVPPHPPADATREARVVSDICTLLHDPGTVAQARAARWITHVLNKANQGRAWWFLRGQFSTTLDAGDDVVDLSGQIDRLAGAWCPKRLTQVPLAQIIEARMDAEANGTSNAGTVAWYALEAGRRVHLWPALAESTAFAVMYYRPMLIASVPDEWETIILDGVLGMFGRHFDRDALTQDPAEFERRFWSAIRSAAVESRDNVHFKSYQEPAEVSTSVTADSASGAATEVDLT